MDEPFDPYYKWLAIPLRDQPPNHYRLLAVDLFETDVDVIDAAADQRMAYLQQVASGEHVDQSQRLLNELSAARRCLLNPGSKADYDNRLRGELNMTMVRPAATPVGAAAQGSPLPQGATAPAGRESPPGPPPPPPPDGQDNNFGVSSAPVEATSAMRRYRTRQSGPTPAHLVAMALIVFVVVSCFIGVYYILSTREDPTSDSGSSQTPKVDRSLEPDAILPRPVMPDDPEDDIPETDTDPPRDKEPIPTPVPKEPVPPEDDQPEDPSDPVAGPNGDPTKDPNLVKPDDDDPDKPGDDDSELARTLTPEGGLKPVVPVSPQEKAEREKVALVKLKAIYDAVEQDDLETGIRLMLECMNDLPKKQMTRASLLYNQMINVDNPKWVRAVIEHLADKQLEDLISGKLKLNIQNPPFVDERLRRLFQKKAAAIAPEILEERRRVQGVEENDFIPHQD